MGIFTLPPLPPTGSFIPMKFKPYTYCDEEITQPLQLVELRRSVHVIMVSRYSTTERIYNSLVANFGGARLTDSPLPTYPTTQRVYHDRHTLMQPCFGVPEHYHLPSILYGLGRKVSWGVKHHEMPLGDRYAVALFISTPDKGRHANTAGVWSAKALLWLQPFMMGS